MLLMLGMFPELMDVVSIRANSRSSALSRESHLIEIDKVPAFESSVDQPAAVFSSLLFDDVSDNLETVVKPNDPIVNRC